MSSSKLPRGPVFNPRPIIPPKPVLFGPLVTNKITPTPVGLKRVLLVGINYKNTPCELYGCINDVNNMSQQLKRFFPKCNDHRIITDDSTTKPTKQNILTSINWLVSGLKPGENVVFHYSGHGGLIRDKNGDEISGYDSCIYSINGKQIEMITDDEIRANLAMKIPKGSKCFVIIDACHSGTAVDLRCLWESPSSTSLGYSENKKYEKTQGTVVFISGCHDREVAMETVDKNGRPSGALTMALLDTWRTYGPVIKFKHILWDIRQYLKTNGYTQLPQMTTGDYIDSNSVFDLAK